MTSEVVEWTSHMEALYAVWSKIRQYQQLARVQKKHPTESHNRLNLVARTLLDHLTDDQLRIVDDRVIQVMGPV